MGQRISGWFEGTGADIFVCIGFVPDWVNVVNVQGTAWIETKWSKHMAKKTAMVEGVSFTGDGTATEETIGVGIRPYWGGDVLTSTNQSDTTYGGGVYIERDDKDYRYFTDNAAGISGDAATTTIDTWTLTTAASNAGNFNGDVTGTYIGPGSTIIIDVGVTKQQYETSIVTLTAGQGVTAGEVVLAYPVPTGKVRFIGGQMGYKPSAIGTTTKPGFWIDLTAASSTLTANDEQCWFEAGTWDSPS